MTVSPRTCIPAKVVSDGEAFVARRSRQAPEVTISASTTMYRPNAGLRGSGSWRPEAETHVWSQRQDLDRYPRDQVTHTVRNRLFTPSIEDRGQAGPWAKPDVARRGAARDHPIPKGLASEG